LSNLANSKWTKTRSALQQTQASSPVHEPQSTAAEPVRVRPRSKHSGRAWRAYTLMLKSETHTEAVIILKCLDNGQDLSDLAQEFFEKWVERHK
jgi:hypothetical protein